MLQWNGLEAALIAAVNRLLYLQHVRDLGLRHVMILAHVPQSLEIHALTPIRQVLIDTIDSMTCDVLKYLC